MRTSQYDAPTRRDMKLDQRSPAYRELQQRVAAQRTKLESKIRERNEVIARLKKKLVEVGCTADDIERLVA